MADKTEGSRKLDKSPVVDFEEADKPLDWKPPPSNPQPSDSWWADMLPQEYSCSTLGDLSESEAGESATVSPVDVAVEDPTPAIAAEASLNGPM